MFDLLGIVSMLFTGKELIKEAVTPVVPAENWANKDLIHRDRMSGLSEKEILKNVERGKYKPTEEMKKHPGCHKTAEGKNIIENCVLHKMDVSKYGAVQAYKWVDQGKYNLTPKELKKEEAKYFKVGEGFYIPQWVIDVFYKKTPAQISFEKKIELALSSETMRITYINCLENAVNITALHDGREYDLWCVVQNKQYHDLDYSHDHAMQDNIIYCLNVIKLINKSSSIDAIKKYLKDDGFTKLTVNCRVEDSIYADENDTRLKHLRIFADKNDITYRAKIYCTHGFENVMNIKDSERLGRWF